ncbi:MAG: thiol peroxidase [Sulfurovum sp.]|nr:thiol peroxidase [Sulfurovum sp.]
MKKSLLLLLVLSSSLLATTVTFQGKEVTLNSKGLAVGADAPQFMAVSKDLVEVSIGGKEDKVQVIAFVPSLDTGVCKLETINFNKNISKMKNVTVKVVSKDLPFAIARFCQDNNISNVLTLSDYKDAEGALQYGTTISAPVFLEDFLEESFI